MSNSSLPTKGPEIQSGTDSRSSRILSVRDISPLFVITILSVLTNILFGHIASIIILVVLLVFTGLTIYRWLNPDRLPNWLAKYVDRVIRRGKIFPLELVLAFGIVYIAVIQITRPYVNDKWYQLGSCLLVIFSFLLTELGNKAAFTGYRGWSIIWELLLRPLFSSRKRRRREQTLQKDGNAEHNPETAPELITAEQLDEMTSSIEPVVKSSCWEQEQQKRWKEWIQEEMHRLDGRSSLDESN